MSHKIQFMIILKVIPNKIKNHPYFNSNFSVEYAESIELFK